MTIEKRARHNKINYIEFAAHDLDKTKAFLAMYLVGNLQIMAPIIPHLKAAI